MELFGRRWDRCDVIVAAAAVTLIVVSNHAWYTLHDEGSDTVWNAWTHWQLSHAVVLGMLAAGLHLAYRSRPEARGAAWLGAVMLVSGLALVGWHWQHEIRPNERERVVIEQYRRRVDERTLVTFQVPTRSAPQWGFYAGAGSLIVMFAAIARGLKPSRL